MVMCDMLKKVYFCHLVLNVLYNENSILWTESIFGCIDTFDIYLTCKR